MTKKIYFFLIVLLSIIGIYFAFNATIIPNFILHLIIFFYGINDVLIFICLFFKRKKKKGKKRKKKKKKKKKLKFLRTIGYILSIIIVLVTIVLFLVNYKANEFLDRITNVEYEKSNYAVIVLKDSNFKKLEDIKTIGIFKNELDKNYALALEELNEKVKINNQECDGIAVQVANLLEEKVDSILINETYIDIINETTEGFKDKVNVIDTLAIKSIKEKKETEKKLKEIGNFNVFISGIDTYGDISNVSRSDVNIIASINVDKQKILLTNTPRDYYVQLHGTTGDKDKLTHAGVYGIDMSMTTLEDLYETDINYYVRVNFNTLISVVDEIGGIDIYSDQALTTLHYQVYIRQGWNHLNGEGALGYARERYAYMDGDRHRGQNQQQIIEAIIKKVTESNDINVYLKLLNVLEKSMQTNFDKKLINDFINLQVKKGYNWSVESIAVTGYDDGGYTYSYPGQYLYVMQPDWDSVDVAKKKIKETLKSGK